MSAEETKKKRIRKEDEWRKRVSACHKDDNRCIYDVVCVLQRITVQWIQIAMAMKIGVVVVVCEAIDNQSHIINCIWHPYI